MPFSLLRSFNLFQPIRWVFSLLAGPDPSYMWLNPRGVELDYRQLEKYEMDVNVTTGKTKLVKLSSVGLKQIEVVTF